MLKLWLMESPVGFFTYGKGLNDCSWRMLWAEWMVPFAQTMWTNRQTNCVFFLLSTVPSAHTTPHTGISLIAVTALLLLRLSLHGCQYNVRTDPKAFHLIWNLPNSTREIQFWQPPLFEHRFHVVSCTTIKRKAADAVLWLRITGTCYMPINNEVPVLSKSLLLLQKKASGRYRHENDVMRGENPGYLMSTASPSLGNPNTASARLLCRTVYLSRRKNRAVKKLHVQ